MNNIPVGLIILGFGGHARSVADVALSLGIKSLLFIDKNARDDEKFLGFKVMRELPGALADGWSCMPAAGDNQKRFEQVEYIHSLCWPLTTLISKSATISVGVDISLGCFVGHHSHIGPMSRVGAGCIINTGAIVEHECQVGNYVHVSVNASLAGRSELGDLVFVGVGASILDGVSIRNGVQIGAGGVVIHSITDVGCYVGVPVRKLD